MRFFFGLTVRASVSVCVCVWTTFSFSRRSSPTRYHNHGVLLKCRAWKLSNVNELETRKSTNWLIELEWLGDVFSNALCCCCVVVSLRFPPCFAFGISLFSFCFVWFFSLLPFHSLIINNVKLPSCTTLCAIPCICWVNFHYYTFRTMNIARFLFFDVPHFRVKHKTLRKVEEHRLRLRLFFRSKCVWGDGKKIITPDVFNGHLCKCVYTHTQTHTEIYYGMKKVPFDQNHLKR